MEYALALHSSGNYLGEFVVVEREVRQGVVVRVSYRDIVRSHRSEKLSSGLTQDKVGLGRRGHSFSSEHLSWPSGS